MQRIVDLGVTLKLNAKVFDLAQTMKDGGYDAAFLAVGAHIAKRAYIPAKDSSRILDAVAVLRSMEGEDKPMLGRRVVVYGGGNTAIDVARTAKRLGATEAVIVYRRTREKMPAHDFEVEEALQEGVMVKWLSTIKRSGDAGALTIEKMVLDANGNPQPTGEFETLEADSLVLALGQDVDLSLLDGVPGLQMQDGVVQVDPATMMTSHPGLFAGGDMVPAERNVTVAVGHGKKAARHIDAWLRGTRVEPPPKHAPATFERLNPWYYSDAPKTLRPQLDIARRTSSFDEVQGGLSAANALFEARRCLSCGNCFECDNCYGVCPDNAVIKLGPGQAFRVQLRLLQGLRHLRRRMPLRRNRHGAGRRLASSPAGTRQRSAGAVRPACSGLQAPRAHDVACAGRASAAWPKRPQPICSIESNGVSAAPEVGFDPAAALRPLRGQSATASRATLTVSATISA